MGESKNIYSRYLQDMQKYGISEEEIAGISVFYKIWTEQFSNVVIPQVCTSLIFPVQYFIQALYGTAQRKIDTQKHPHVEPPVPTQIHKCPPRIYPL